MGNHSTGVLNLAIYIFGGCFVKYIHPIGYGTLSLAKASAYVLGLPALSKYP